MTIIEEKCCLEAKVDLSAKLGYFAESSQILQRVQFCATQVHKHDGQRLPVPCRFILDEFATTCTIPNFVKILAYARSLGIGITPIIQSLEQLKNMYKDEWGVIIDNCNTMLFLGSVTHMDTLEYISKLVGKGTFDKRTTITRNAVAMMYPGILRNRNNEIKNKSVDTTFTLGSSLCNILFAG